MAERLRRYVQVVVNFVGVGSSPTECNTFFVFFVGSMLLSFGLGGLRCLRTSLESGRVTHTDVHWSLKNMLRNHVREKSTNEKRSP